MQQCPKCLTSCSDEVKICRTCGAILPGAERRSAYERPANEELPVTDDASPAMEPDEEAAASCGSCCCQHGSCGDVPSDRPGWKCPQCGQSVPGGFEVCWNCGTTADGVADPTFKREPLDEEEGVAAATVVPEEIVDESLPAGPTRCPRCGSSKIVANAKVLDHLGGRLEVAVDADPEALVFKDRLLMHVVADICADCGHVELTVEHPAALYDHHHRRGRDA